jgi:hypothetical protein
MKEIIINYLNKNYKLTLSSYITFMLEERASGENVKVADILKTLKPIFDINDDELMQIFDSWVDLNETIFNNKLVEINYKLYEKTGIDLGISNLDSVMNLQSEEYNQLIETLEEQEDTL